MMTVQLAAARGPDATRAALPYAYVAMWWLWVSVAAAVVAATANVAALAGIGDVYASETAPFVNQAIAQDIISLAIVCPAIIVCALLALRGSMTAYLVWLGALAFTVYNYVIYTVSIHAGALFLPWIAVLGLSLFATAGGVVALDWTVVQTLSGMTSKHRWPVASSHWIPLAPGTRLRSGQSRLPQPGSH